MDKLLLLLLLLRLFLGACYQNISNNYNTNNVYLIIYNGSNMF